MWPDLARSAATAVIAAVAEGGGTDEGEEGAGANEVGGKLNERRKNRIGSENPLIKIKLKRHEPVEKGLRRLKKQMLREGVIRELKKRRHYEKPSVTLRRKRKAASFEAML